MTRLLVSVREEGEAREALAGGAQIIDFKDPSRGALGAVAPALIGRGVAAVAGHVSTSATAGDWPLEPSVLTGAARTIGATGVDYVKLGLLPGDRLDVCIDALRPVAGDHRLIAVFFADRGVPFESVAGLARAGFSGAMIDSFDKAGGGLRQNLDDATLARFVRTVRAAGLMAGLAGSLELHDIAPLVRMAPDLLGFRGAVCTGGRAGVLTASRVALVRATLDRAVASRAA